MMRYRMITLVLVMLCGCGGGSAASPNYGAEDNPVPPAPHAVKMQHQILFEGENREDVFDGYMVLTSDGFVVRAFAGPGVSLFTVARRGGRRLDVLHIDGLADRIDVRQVGDDINRVYLVGCGGDDAGAGERRCNHSGERVIERYDDNGNLTEKSFPDAHGIGLVVTYEGYRTVVGQRLPKKIILRWGTSSNRMVILMTAVSTATDDAVEGIDSVLSGK